MTKNKMIKLPMDLNELRTLVYLMNENIKELKNFVNIDDKTNQINISYANLMIERLERHIDKLNI